MQSLESTATRPSARQAGGGAPTATGIVATALARLGWWLERLRGDGEAPTHAAVMNVRTKTSIGLAIAALVILSPFAVNHLIKGRYLLGAASVAVITIVTVNAWFILRGRTVGWLTPAVLVPAVIGFLVMCFEQQGEIGVFWAYPALISFYFMLSPGQARIANLAFLAVVIPEASFVLPVDLTIRFSATLLAVSVFSVIFVCILSRQEHQLRKMAVTDQLTGLLNRKTLEQSLSRAIRLGHRSGRPMALITIDLDRFKAINDTRGHGAGDTVLRAVGASLSERMRSSDQVFRLGGEEFLALLYDTDSVQARRVADDLRHRITALDVLPDCRITASFGVTGLRPDDGWNEWLQRADAHLYRAKSAGRDRVVADSQPLLENRAS